VLGPGSLYCDVLYGELQFSTNTGNMLVANALSNLFVDTGCGGAAI
jgi:hypothetical protein